MNDFPTLSRAREGPETCQTCTADQRLKKIEEQLAIILKIVDTTAKAVLELKNTNGGNHARR